MSESFLAAAIQMCSREDKQENLREATRLVEQAAADGARLIALPEMFNCLGHFEAMLAAAEPIPGPTSQAMSALARRLGVTLLAGSICERCEEQPEKAYNTSLLFGPDGAQLAAYRKIHLFDISLAGCTGDLADRVRIQESRYIAGGCDIVCSATPLARLGQAICYDLRFPELFRCLADAATEVILLPSAFTRATGEHHWKVLIRSRAIENLSYVIAPNQVGFHTERLVSYGHTIVVDPWGRVLAELDGDVPGVAMAEIDLEMLRDIRRQLPALEHRRGLERLLD